MASRPNYNFQEKPLAQVLAEFKDELKEFVSTRVAMLRAEMSEKVSSLTSALPAIAVGAVLAIYAVLLLSIAVVALVAMALGGGTGAWAAAFAIVGFGLLLIAAIALLSGLNKLKARNLKPERTLRVLQQDRIWLQNEARNRQ